MFNNSFSEEVWSQKHKFHTDNTIEDNWLRVSKDLASIETDAEFWQKEFYDVLKDFAFVPGGRILGNAGTGLKGTTYINCFAGSTEIITCDGVAQIGTLYEELKGKDTYFLVGNKQWAKGTIQEFGEQTLYEITIERAGIHAYIYTTEEHRWFIHPHSIEVLTKDLKEGHQLLQGYNSVFSPWKVVEVRKTDKVEKVYCAVVPEHHKFTLAYNILTGNCFVDGFEGQNQDSIDGIYNALKRQAQILKSEGGYGFCMSVIRPRGAYIKGIANQSPGAVKYLELWDKSSEIITSGAIDKKKNSKSKNDIRKGAQMVTCPDWHPDVLEFITAKQEPGRLTKFNMSVLCSDNFMHAVENDDQWVLFFPDYEKLPELYAEKWDGSAEKWFELTCPSGNFEEGFKVYETLPARELWNKIMTSTYNRNEPGVIFIDTVNRMNNLWYCEHLMATNPSLRAGTLVLTKNGPRRIETLQDTEFDIINAKGGTSKAKCWLSGKNKQLYEIKLSTGMSYFCTAEHKWDILVNDKKVKTLTTNLKIGDKLPTIYNDRPFGGSYGDYDEGFLLGWFLGDGWLTIRGDNGKGQFGLITSEDDKNSGIQDKLTKILVDKFDYHGGWSARNRDDLKPWYEINTGNTKIVSYLESIGNPSKKNGISNFLMENMCHEMVLGLIDGYLSSDGHISKPETTHKRITFTSSNKKILVDISEILGFYGIHTNIKDRKTKSSSSQFPNGKDYNKTYIAYDLSIHKIKSIKRFGSIFTLSHTLKQEKLTSLINKEQKRKTRDDFVTIKSVTQTEIKENVWDITVFDDDNSFVLSHCLTGNCSEQTLPNGGVCLLGSINLTQFVNSKHTGWDYEKLSKYLPIIVRMLDNVNDRSNVPLEIQKKNMLEKRRMGVGYMGYASALLMMKTRYGSKKALRITEELCEFVTNELYKASALLAKEKGPFKLFDKEKYLQSKFVERLKPETIELIKKHGIRNSHLGSVQPTGNTAIVANIVSGGLEPVFAHEYYRTSIQHIIPEGLNTPVVDWKNKTFTSSTPWKWVKEGDEDLLMTEFNGKTWKFDRSRGLLKEELVEDYGVKYLKSVGKWDAEAEWAAPAYDLNVDDHISTMKIFANWVDASLSKTLNCANNYPYDDFKKCYMDAWKAGIKGFTTYREGTMTTVLSTKSVSVEESQTRPKELKCDIHHLTVKHQKYFVLVGLSSNGTPYEVFCGKNNASFTKQKQGIILRTDRPKQYKLVTEDGEFSPLNAFCEDHEEGLARMISLLLRNNVPIQQVVQQLERTTGDDIYGFTKSIARALKKYIPDGTKEEESCPECDKHTLVREAGCIVCKNCGFSKCQ